MRSELVSGLDRDGDRGGNVQVAAQDSGNRVDQSSKMAGAQGESHNWRPVRQQRDSHSIARG